MPVKKRNPKRRIDPAAECAAWSMMLLTGRDFLDDLQVIGVAQKPSRAAAESAWRRHGSALLAEWAADPKQPTPWALEQFGEPNNAR